MSGTEPRDGYEKIFSKLPCPEPPDGLGQRILFAIERRERRILAVKTAVAAALCAGSLWVAMLGYADLMGGFAQSGFLTLASLLFSDFSVVAANLPDFLLSMVESFPIFSAATLLGGVTFAIWSIGLLVEDAVRMNGRRFSMFH